VIAAARMPMCKETPRPVRLRRLDAGESIIDAAAEKSRHDCARHADARCPAHRPDDTFRSSTFARNVIQP
jgi:hypothetical protein